MPGELLAGSKSAGSSPEVTAGRLGDLGGNGTIGVCFQGMYNKGEVPALKLFS